MNEWVPLKRLIEVVSGKLYYNKLVLIYVLWYRVTQNPQELHRLTGGQQDPRDRGVTAWYQSIGTRVPRA